MTTACVLYGQNANITDVLMDRAVLNDANLVNANLSRTVLTRCAFIHNDVCVVELSRVHCAAASSVHEIIGAGSQLALTASADQLQSVTFTRPAA